MVNKIKENEAENLLNLIIGKGGLFGHCARGYKGKKNETNLYLKECSEQCHLEGARMLWGDELVLRILKYNITYNHNKKSLTLNQLPI